MPFDSATLAPAATITFLFTDIEGSTRLLQEIGAGYPMVLEEHTKLLQSALDNRGGRVVDRAGDGLFVVFESASGALLGAVEAQRALLEHAWPAGVRVHVRMGLHTGEAVRSGSSWVGLDVHRAARVAAVAHGAQIILSEATRQLIADDLPAGIDLLDLGEHRLKDLPRAQRLYQVIANGLPSTFPPLRTASGLPGNLPTRPTRLIGRDADVRTIHDMLRREDVRLLTLTGPGGTGKTSLAVELAARSLSDFTDGITYVPLAALTDAALVPAAIAQTLGASAAAGQTPEEAVTEHLRNRRMLLVLDNFEHVLEAAAGLANLIAACPGITLLVTSRFALNLSVEREFPVAPLRTPDPRSRTNSAVLRAFPSVELFAQRATAVDPAFSLDEESTAAVAEICRRLDGLPLAIELAAARIKIFSPRALLARLDRRLELLSGGARDAPARHRTLRHAIGWSYDLLDPGEQAIFRRLAAFSGGCSLDAAEVVCAAAGDPAPPALDGLSALVDKSLLRQDPGEDGEPRFVMLETVREFALEKLEASGEGAVTRAAHADHFIHLADTAAPQLAGAGQSHWLDRLDRELDNLRAAFDWAIRDRDAARALRLGAALHRFWIIRALHTEARERMSAALALPCSAADRPARARVLVGSAISAYEQSDVAEARERLVEALEWYREAGDVKGVGETLNHLGWVAFFSGEIDRATSLSDEALASHEKRGDTRGIALSLTNLASVALFHGDVREANDLYARALERRRSLQEARSIAYGQVNLAWTVRILGRSEEAAAMVEEALRTVRALDDKQIIIFGSSVLGEILLDRGDPEGALRILEPAIDYARTIREPSAIGYTTGFAAEACALLGWRERALELASEAAANQLRSGIMVRRIISLTSVASVQRLVGETGSARHNYLCVLADAAPNGARLYTALATAGLADLASREGDHAAALRLAAAARALRESTDAAGAPAREPDLEAIIAAGRTALGAEAAARALELGARRAFADPRTLLSDALE